MRTALNILALLLIVSGAALVFTSPLLAKRRLRQERAAEEEGPAAEAEALRLLKLNLRYKLRGLILLLPGFILVLLLYATRP